MSDILTLAKKMERALRNGTGFKVTPEEVSALLGIGVLERIHSAKFEELKARCPAKTANTQSENTGSTSAATERPRVSTRLPATPRNHDQTYIAALGLGT